MAHVEPAKKVQSLDTQGFAAKAQRGAVAGEASNPWVLTTTACLLEQNDHGDVTLT